jgi:hypothetical protein
MNNAIPITLLRFNLQRNHVQCIICSLYRWLLRGLSVSAQVGLFVVLNAALLILKEGLTWDVREDDSTDASVTR